MAQILDSLPTDGSGSILCCYVNATSKIQVARITNVPDWYFERVVFPGQRLLFEALPIANLEIHTGMMASAILSDTIPCTRLLVEANDTPSYEPGERQQGVSEAESTVRLAGNVPEAPSVVSNVRVAASQSSGMETASRATSQANLKSVASAAAIAGAIAE